MTRRTTLSLLYAGPTWTRWMQTAIDTAGPDMSSVCRWQWQRVSIVPVRARTLRKRLSPR